MFRRVLKTIPRVIGLNNNQVVKLLTLARKNFINPQESKGISGQLCTLQSGVKLFQIKGYRIFGINKKDQDRINYALLRANTAKTLGGSDQFIQFLGDSAVMDENGTTFSRNQAKMDLFKDNSKILYGFTGNLSEDGKQADINQIISECVDQYPQLADRVIANVVDEHTITAIKQWNCTIPSSIKNFFLVYTDGPKPEAKFGDDFSSDKITNKKAYCYDGGIQSLAQLITMLNDGVSIDCFTQLRAPLIEPNSKLPFLSAAEFLGFLKNNFSDITVASKFQIEHYVTIYLKSHALYNSAKGDAGTKQALFDSAMEKFYKYEVWKKLDRFTLKNCPNKIDETHSLFGGNVAAKQIIQNSPATSHFKISKL